jgi:hypothetical protein
MIYYQKHGRRFFKEQALEDMAGDPGVSVDDLAVLEGPLELHASLVESKFDLQRIIKNRIAFCGYVSEKLSVPAEPTYAGFQEWASRVEPEQAGPTTYWLTTGKKVVKVEKLAYRILSIGATKKLPVKELVAALPERAAGKMLAYLLELEESGLIGFELRPAKRRIEQGDANPVRRDRALHLPPRACGSPPPPVGALVQLTSA